MEGEIVCLCKFCAAMGALVLGHGTEKGKLRKDTEMMFEK